MAKEKSMPLSRVHLHPYGAFLICYDQSKWHDAYEAIIKSSIVVPKYCLRNIQGETPLDWFRQDDVYEIPAYLSSLELPFDGSEPLEMDKESLTTHFDLDSDGATHCYMQFFIKCNKMFKTAGMGDTISSTGWIYHEPKPFN